MPIRGSVNLSRGPTNLHTPSTNVEAPPIGLCKWNQVLQWGTGSFHVSLGEGIAFSAEAPAFLIQFAVQSASLARIAGVSNSGWNSSLLEVPLSHGCRFTCCSSPPAVDTTSPGFPNLWTQVSWTPEAGSPRLSTSANERFPIWLLDGQTLRGSAAPWILNLCPLASHWPTSGFSFLGGSQPSGSLAF